MNFMAGGRAFLGVMADCLVRGTAYLLRPHPDAHCFLLLRTEPRADLVSSSAGHLITASKEFRTCCTQLPGPSRLWLCRSTVVAARLLVLGWVEAQAVPSILVLE